jgi:hypothetical protein
MPYTATSWELSARQELRSEVASIHTVTFPNARYPLFWNCLRPFCGKNDMTPFPETHKFRYCWTDFAILLIFVLTLTFPFWIHLNNLPSTKDLDALQNLAFGRVFVDAIWNYHQFPVWNPYFGGGVPWAGMVWNPSLTPLSLLLVSFGEVIGFKVWFGLILFCGAMGMYLTCSDILRTSRVAALLSGLLFSGSLWAAGRLEDGNYVDFGLLLLPLCIFAFRQFLRKHWVGCLLPLIYLSVWAMSRYEVFLVVAFVLIFTLFLRKHVQASYSRIVLGWLGTFLVFVILALPKLIPLLDLLDANMVELRVSPDGLRPRMLMGSIVYSPEISLLFMKYLSFDPLKYFPLPVSPRHLIGIKTTALALVLSAGVLKLRQTAALWVILALMFLLACGSYAPLPIWRLFAFFPVLNTMLDFTKYWNVFVLFTLCGLAAIGFDAITEFFGRIFVHPERSKVQEFVLAAIFIAAVLHPAAYSFWINWGLYQAAPHRDTPEQFSQVASSRWLGVTDTRWRVPNPSADGTSMYFNLQKNRGTITWYGNIALRENAAPKFLIDVNGTEKENPDYRGEVYCATVQWENCEIDDFTIGYDRLTIRTGKNFTEPSKIIFNFNYDPRWSSRQATVMNHNGLLAVGLSDTDSRNQIIILTYRDRRFLIGIAFFLIGGVLWPIWYFRYYGVDRRLLPG